MLEYKEVLMEVLTLPEKDPSTSRLFVTVKVDSQDAADLQTVWKKVKDLGDPDDTNQVNRVNSIRAAIHEAWATTNPS